MSTYNVQWLRDFVGEVLAYDSSEPDQAYGGTTAAPWKRIDRYLNEAYTELINEVRLSVDQSNFLARYAFTWSSGETTYELPRDIAYSKSEQLLDVTDRETGEEFPVHKSRRAGGPFWQDNRTLHWGDTSGPSEDKDFIWEYLADAEELTDPLQVPLLMPWRHRHLLAWKAATLARMEVDEDNLPMSWLKRVDKLVDDYILDLGQGRLRFTVPPHAEPAVPDASLGVNL